jgi:hypothetical protein
MINVKKQSVWKRIALSALTLASSFSSIANGNSGTLLNPVSVDNFLKNDYSARVREEHTEDTNTHLNKITFGVAPTSTPYGKGNEIYRSYHVDGEENGKKVDYDSYGFLIPRFKTGNLETSVSIYGEAGDKESVGAESVTNIGKLDIYFVGENSATTDSKREGFGLDYGYQEKLNFGARIDRVETPKGDVTYTSGKFVGNMDNNNQAGIGFKLADNDTVGTSRLAAFFMRYGKGVNLGNRTYTLYDWKNGLEAITFSTIFAQNTNFVEPIHGKAVVGSNQGYFLSSEIIKAPETVVETVPINERSKGGFAFGGAANLTKTPQTNGYKGTTEIDAGYNFGKLGFYVFEKNGVGGVRDSRGLCASYTLPLSRGCCLKIEGSTERFEDACYKTWASMSAFFPLCGK